MSKELSKELSNRLAKCSAQWMVVVSVGGKFVASHECEDRQRAQVLLHEVRDLASDLMYLLPGLTAEGYELQQYE